MLQPTRPNRLALVLAFVAVYIVWGSTYLANIVAIETIPPFLLVVARLTLAGSLLLGFVALRQNWSPPTRRQWRNLAVTSFLFLTVGLGAVVWAEQYIESGTTALLVAAEPLLVVLVLWAFDRKRPRWQAFAGIALGIIGTLVLVGQDIVLDGEGAWWGIGAIVLAISAWAVGSVLTARVSLPQNRVQTAGLQMMLAGVMSIPFALALGDFSAFELSAVSIKSAWAFTYLVVFGSVVAYSSFLYLLQHVSPEKVASSTYVHPVVALALGVLLRDEVVTGQTLVACVILLAGVLVVNGKWSKRKAGAIVQPRQSNSASVWRAWTGKALPGKTADLQRFIEEVVLPDMRAAEGNLSAELQKQEDDAEETLHITSTWTDDAAERAYVAGDVERPKVYEGEAQLVDAESERVARKALT